MIAEKYGVENLSHILIANDLSNASKLRIGQKLLLPNPTKDPNPKKPDIKTLAIVPKVAPPAVTKVPTNKPKEVKSAAAVVASNALKSISYGSYTLHLQVPS